MLVTYAELRKTVGVEYNCSVALQLKNINFEIIYFSDQIGFSRIQQ